MIKNLKVIAYSMINKEDWNEYVMHHEHGSIFQHASYLNCHTRGFKSTPFGFAAIESGKIVGLVGGVIMYNYFYPLSVFTKRAIIEGGPLAENKAISEVLLKSVTDYAKRNAIYTQFRNMWDMCNEDDIFKQYGYSYEPHLDFVHDLTIGEENIIAQISPKKRAKVRKSLNNGVEFCEAKPNELGRCIDLIQDTYKSVGLPCQSRDYFFAALKGMEEIVKVFMAKYEGEIIGVRIELCLKDLVYDWYASSDDNYKDLNPNDFISYHVLLWSAASGYKTFDFGGAGKPDVHYGVRDFKAKFGGQLVEYGRYERINKKLLMAVGKIGLSLMKKK